MSTTHGTSTRYGPIRSTSTPPTSDSTTVIKRWKARINPAARSAELSGDVPAKSSDSVNAKAPSIAELAKNNTLSDDGTQREPAAPPVVGSVASSRGSVIATGIASRPARPSTTNTARG